MSFSLYSCLKAINSILVLGLLLLFPIRGYAVDCFNKELYAEIKPCLGKELVAARNNLEHLHLELREKLLPDYHPALEQTFAAWEAYRDAQCAFNNAGYEDGSIYSSIMMLCTIELMEHFTAILKSQLHCEEGTLTCGGKF